MPRIEQSVQIHAPLPHVYRIAKDVEAFPQFMADLQSLTVKERSPDGTRTVTDWVGLIREFRMKIVWTQEEPQNMGAWTFVEPRVRNILPKKAEENLQIIPKFKVQNYQLTYEEYIPIVKHICVCLPRHQCAIYQAS